MARDEKYIKLLINTLQNDKNKPLLDKVLSEEALNLLRVQENENDTNYSVFSKWKDKTEKKTPTVSYGITKDGIHSAGKYTEYSMLGYNSMCINEKPFYLEAKNVNKTWNFLNDDSQPVALRNELARRISQYHAVLNSAILDGYTNNKFSNDYNDIERQLTLLNYHRLNMAAKVDFENSMSIQGIRLNNHAMLAQSFIQVGTGEIKDYIKQGKLAQDADRRNLFNSRFFFSGRIPTPEEYLKYLKPINKDNIKDELKKTYTTIGNAATHWAVDNGYELERPKADLTGYDVHSVRIFAPTEKHPHTAPTYGNFSSKNYELAKKANQQREDNTKQINEVSQKQNVGIGQSLVNLFKDLGKTVKNYFTNGKKSDNIDTQEINND